MTDFIACIRAAPEKLREQAAKRALDELRNFDGTDPSKLVQAAGWVKGQIEAADTFEAAVKEALGADEDEDDDRSEA